MKFKGKSMKTLKNDRKSMEINQNISESQQKSREIKRTQRKHIESQPESMSIIGNQQKFNRKSMQPFEIDLLTTHYVLLVWKINENQWISLNMR